MDDLAPRKPKSNVPKILLIVGCAVLVLGGGCIALVVGIGYWGVSFAEDVICKELETNSVVTEHLGSIATCDVEWMKSGQSGSQELEIRLEGSLGDGTVYARVDESPDGDRVEILSGRLVLEDGSEYELLPEGPPEEPAAEPEAEEPPAESGER